MSVITPLVLVGGGGHASDVLQAIEALNDQGATYLVVGLLDDEEVDPAGSTAAACTRSAR